MEERDAFTLQKITNITARAMEIANIKGMEKALKYINEDACDTNAREGSVTYRQNRRLSREAEDRRVKNLPAPGTMKY